MVAPGGEHPDAAAMTQAVRTFDAQHPEIEVELVESDGTADGAAAAAKQLVDAKVAAAVGHVSPAVRPALHRSMQARTFHSSEWR